MLLTGFSTSAADAQAALAGLAVDPKEGTTLYDSLVQSARALGDETNAGRVLIAVTDGNETRSAATLENAIAVARESGVPSTWWRSRARGSTPLR